MKRLTSDDTRGFTLLEVMLFLAISAALTAIALIGMGGRIRNVRFSAGMRDMESYIASQLSAAKLGENTELSSDCSADGFEGRLMIEENPAAVKGAQSECVVMGKALAIRDVGIFSYTIIGRRVARHADCDWKTRFLSCYRPSVVPQQKVCDLENMLYPSSDVRLCFMVKPPDPYVYKNGIEWISSAGGTGTFGFMVDPITGSLHQFTYNGTFADLGGINVYDRDTNPAYVEHTVCFGLSGRTAGLHINLEKPEPILIFEDPAC